MKFFARIFTFTIGRLGRSPRGRLLWKPHLYGELTLSSIILAGILGTFLWLLWQPNPEEAQRTAKNWQSQPQLVWTKAESDELTRQITNSASSRDGITIKVDQMWGAGPPAADLSAIPGTLPLNRISAQLNARHREKLRNGEIFRGTFDDDNPPALYRRLSNLNIGARGQTIAYQKALIAFRNSAFERSREDLEGAPCNARAPNGPGGAQDPGARERAWQIRCHWLNARLDVALGTGPSAVEKFRDAVNAVEKAQKAPDAQGNATTNRTEIIAALGPADYMMDLSKEGVASLWQDYLVALLKYDQALCSKRCAESGATKTADGRVVDLMLAHSSAGEYWKSYPELAVLMRMLLTREGDTNAARRITLELEDGNSNDNGFQLYRFPRGEEEVTLPDVYLKLAMISEYMIGEKLAEKADDPNINTDLAVEFWRTHAASRLNRLNGTNESDLPFSAGSVQRAAFEDMQENWDDQWYGSIWPRQFLEVLFAVILAIWLVIFLWLAPAANAHGQRRVKDWHEIMGSAFVKAKTDPSGDK